MDSPPVGFQLARLTEVNEVVMEGVARGTLHRRRKSAIGTTAKPPCSANSQSTSILGSADYGKAPPLDSLKALSRCPPAYPIVNRPVQSRLDARCCGSGVDGLVIKMDGLWMVWPGAQTLGPQRGLRLTNPSAGE